jgi:hypothetical protein
MEGWRGMEGGGLSEGLSRDVGLREAEMRPERGCVSSPLMDIPIRVRACAGEEKGGFPLGVGDYGIEAGWAC